MPLGTPANFRARYPQLGVSTDEDPTLTEFFAGVDDLIATFSGYPEKVGGGHTMQSATYELFVDGPSPREPAALCVCVRPIISVTAVHADLTRVYAAGALLVEGVGFSKDSQGGMLIRTYPDGWPVGWRSVRVTLVAGYATTPPGLLEIACAAVRHLWDRRHVAGQESYSVGGSSASLADADALLPQAVKEALESYMTPCGLARLWAMKAAA